jgi:hypothetical protein
VLELLDVVEVDAVKDDPGRIEAAEPLADDAVDCLVIGHGGLPALAPDETDGLHASACS